MLTNLPHTTDFTDQSFDPEKPHPYAISELAYQRYEPNGNRTADL